MTPPARALLDTSVFIVLESDRPMNARDAAGPVRQLQAGVLITADIEVLAIDAEVAAEWARLRVHLAETGRRVNVNDLWIAATAAANGLPVVTQDDDFGPLEGAAGLM